MMWSARCAAWLRCLLFVSAIGAVGCNGPGRIQYEGGRCLEDGRTLTAQQVESAQARVTRRIASRQPWFAVITIGVVLLAAVGNAEKVLLLIRARQVEGDRPFFESLRGVLSRQRERPALFAAIVGSSLTLIFFAGVAYVYLDIDKRVSERALGMLQFCHLALRTQQEEGVLNEQRRNLQAIQSTASDIRKLVGELPPDEQRKAQLIIDQMNGALTSQGKIVSAYLERTDEAQRDLSAHNAAMEKGLASVEGELGQLRALPANLKDLEGAAHRIDETTTSFDGRLADLRARLAALDAKRDANDAKLDAKLDALLARPTCDAPSTGPSAAKTNSARADSGSPQAVPHAPARPDAGKAGT